MMSRTVWLMRLLTRKLWVRVSTMALIGVATAIAGVVLAPYVPDALTIQVGAQAIDGILNVLASSMLAVTVFSMSTMVAAFGAATNNVTPRATRLLMEDQTSQNVLGTFIGSFLFSLVGIIALSTGLYGTQGRAILLVVTIALIALIAVTILRWIDYLARFGRLGETIDRVETAARKAMESRLAAPHLGGVPSGETAPPDTWPVFAATIGYVQHVDIAALQHIASERDLTVIVNALPGAFADPVRPVARVAGRHDEDGASEIAAAFSVGKERTYDQDPRFGLCVLAEIASRALSPAVNDPGTAIDVIGRGVRLLVNWERHDADGAQEAECPRVQVPAIAVGDLIDDMFAPIARDGASMVEVQLRLQKAYAALAQVAGPAMATAVRRHSKLALSRAISALASDHERHLVREAAADVSAILDRRSAGTSRVRRA